MISNLFLQRAVLSTLHQQLHIHCYLYSGFC